MMSSSNRFVRMVVSLATGALLIGSAACGNGEHSQRHVTLSASWAAEYESLGALKRSADLAVQGEFERTIRVTMDEHRIPYTDFGFTVQRILLRPRSGSPVSVGGTVEIHQTGAASSDVITEVEDDPLFRIRDRAVLFLHEYSPGKYFVIGGPSGRFSIVHGVVTPINNEGVPFSGDLASFVSALNAAK
jgi:hypothetical protein